MFSKASMIIEKNPDAMAYAAARIFINAAEANIKDHGRFNVALSGGSTPRRMHVLLSEKPFGPAVQWKKIHIFWGDERCVPLDDPASNCGAARNDFLDRVPIPEANIHPMSADMDPAAAALFYQKALEKHLPRDADGFPVFDLIFLGIGIDGHIASLFPEDAALDETERWVVAARGGAPDVMRLTLTFPVLNRAKQIAFMISGKKKAKLVRTLFEEEGLLFPAQRIQPIRGKLLWILDAEAASRLTSVLSHDAF
ncbi:MAG: 6-phosphogluconolactonase [Desulfobacterales bacterium]|nr:6-phosphogluconolactonase [Desulfobacterales bacterium]MDD4072453.1 6-phosphogluconolactonase [Desulfobacterales bacterium]MDD4393151.1 6-phosphogluconolactonase [Desulfobacterales bacterium]